MVMRTMTIIDDDTVDVNRTINKTIKKLEDCLIMYRLYNIINILCDKG